MNIEKTKKAIASSKAMDKATSVPGALVLAAIAGIGAFFIRRKLMHAKPLSAAMSAATIAATAFGSVRKANASQ